MNLFNKRIFLDSAGGQNNPSAIHKEGREAKEQLEGARMKVARLLRAGVADIIFTSSGTESDNLAVLGVFEYFKNKLPRPHIIVSDIEHPAVLESAREAERRGARLSIVSVSDEYLIDPQEVMKLVTPETILISVALVDGVTGAVEPIQKITRLVREYRKANNTTYPFVHTDASQAPLVLDVSVDSLGVDLMTLDSGKFYGPKCGMLVVRPHATLASIVFGGGQERGLRAGTENIEAVLGFADTLQKAIEKREGRVEQYKELRSYFIDAIRKQVSDVVIHGSEHAQAPHIVAVSVPGILSEFIAVALDERGIAVSAGSACASEGNTDDSVLLRFSFSDSITKRELDRVIENFSDIVRRAKMGA